jgi:UDP-perosamine 4-acetyltransferase
MSADARPVCVILGAGGHARVVLDRLLAGGATEVRAALDPDPRRWGQALLGVPILGGDDRLPELAGQGVTHAVIAVGGVGDNRPRRGLFELILRRGLVPLTVRHPSSVCSVWAAIGEGTVVLPRAVVAAGARVGRNVILNTGAIVEHDCEVGDHAHLASGAVLGGQVRVAALAHVGAGATVRQGVVIGEGAIVGAGAAVVNDVAPWTTVMGVPARPRVATAWEPAA